MTAILKLARKFMDSPFLQSRLLLLLLFLLIALACVVMLLLSRRYQDPALRRRVIFLATFTFLVLLASDSRVAIVIKRIVLIGHGLLVTSIVVVGLVVGLTLLIYRHDDR